MDGLADDVLAAILALLSPAERHAVAPVSTQWDRVVRNTQHQLHLDFSQPPGADIGCRGGAFGGPCALLATPSSSGCGDSDCGSGAGSSDSGPGCQGDGARDLAAEALLAGAALRTIVALDVSGLRTAAQGALLARLAPVLHPTLARLELHWGEDVYCRAEAAPHAEWVTTLTQLRCLTLARGPGVPAGLPALAALTSLAIHRCDGPEWALPAAVSRLQSLRALQVWGSCLCGELGALGALPLLSVLDLHETHVHSVGWLQGLTALTFLRLNNLNNFATAHSPEAWDAALRPLTRLRHLDLEANELRELPPAVARLARLTALRLGFNPLAGLPAGGRYLAALRLLDVAYTRVKELPLPPAAPPGSLAALRTLCYGCDDDPPAAGHATPVAVPARRFLAQPGALPALRQLYVTDDLPAALAQRLAAALPGVAVEAYQLGVGFECPL